MLELNFRTSRAMLALAFLVAMVTTTVARADSLTLAWDANAESSVVGYFVYIGTSSGVYSTTVDVGKTTKYTFTSAVPGTTYYMNVAAYAAGPVVGARAVEVVTNTTGSPILTNPGSRTSPRGTALTLALTATDPNQDVLTFTALGLPAGLSINPTTGIISGTPTTAGTFSASVTVADTSANVASQFFTWTVVATDAAAPTITITSPTTSATYSTAAAFVTLTGAATDDVAVTGVTWSNSKGGSGTAAGTSSWSVVIPLQTGSNVLTVTAVDATNKSTTDSLTATVTTTVDQAPVVTITSPTTAATSTSNTATITLGGTASDDKSLSAVKWSNDRGGSGTATGTTSWSVAGIALQSGTNVLTITAQDGAGQSSTDTLSVTWTPPSTAALQLTALTASKTSPQATGATVTFSAAATGGSAPYQYKWKVYNGATWTVAQTWSTSATFNWTPTVAGSAYQIEVWARNAGNTADAAENVNSTRRLAFAITAPAPAPAPTVTRLTLTSLTANKTAPQAPSTTITFTATASGGTGPYQYKWWVFDGYLWTVKQGWSTSNTFAWTPKWTGNNYQVAVWVRNAGSTVNAADNSEADGVMDFPIVKRRGR